MEEFRIEEEIREEKNPGGFWKGFFCATLLFMVVAVVSFCVGLYMKGAKPVEEPVEEPEDTYISGLVTQSEDVRKKLGKLEIYIRNYFLDEIDDEQLEDYLYYGLIAGLGDPYAGYYNEEETQSMMDSSAGNYCGIGAVFSQNMMTGIITITKLYEGFPAHMAGMLPGDILYTVDGENVSVEDLTNVVTKIKGEENTEVKISVIRGEEEVGFTMKRQFIEVPTVEYEMLEEQVGYILITEFDQITSSQFHEALSVLQTQGMKKLVIDLRNNGGGNVDAVSQIADELLPEGLIVYTEYVDGKRVDRSSDAECIDIPMAVLVNENSASASEILAGALQDYGVAEIVGTQTYGKGIVQSVFDLQDGTALKLTTAKYYTPNGNNIHGVGITPDVEIEMPEELKTEVTLSFEEDVQLQKAIEVLQQ